MNSHESMLRIAADSDISVLLLGESGSGKEVAAQFIHNHSKRASGPFVALNCGAIAKGLAESILEGYRKGAFTGASEERLGIVRSANHGTLFLDRRDAARNTVQAPTDTARKDGHAYWRLRSFPGRFPAHLRHKSGPTLRYLCGQISRRSLFQDKRFSHNYPTSPGAH